MTSQEKAEGWAVTKPAFFKTLFIGLRQIVPHIRKCKMKKSLHINGISRHKEEEIYECGKRDLGAWVSGQHNVCTIRHPD